MTISTLKIGTLMIFLTLLLMVAGYFMGGRVGVTIALIFSLGINFFSYWYSDRIALSMARAKEVSREQVPALHWIVEEQARLAQIPKPKIYIIQSDSPNAFATGRSPNHAAVAATTGIMKLLNKQELTGVIAHEMAHVRTLDTLIMTMAAAIAGAVTWMAFMARFSMLFGGMGGGYGRRQGGDGGLIPIIGLLVVAIVLPIVALLVRLAISRAREYQADAIGARMSKAPWALADALEKLDSGVRRSPMKVNEGVTHLFIVNPLSGRSMARLFSTHPPMSERIKRLKSMRSY